MTKHTYDDADLERMIRDGLRHHAGDAPSDLGAPLPGSGGSRSSGVATAAAVPPSSPRWRWVLPAAAAVAALAVPGAILVANTLRDNDSGVTDPVAGASRSASTGADSSTTSESPKTAATADGRPAGIPADWRPESYGGVQLWVPPTWGWGGAPMAPDWGNGEVLDCSEGRAFTVPGSSAYEFVPDGVPYVGRPVMMTDACVGSPDVHPKVDAVWFDAAGVKAGTESYPDGVVRETRSVGEVTVTVFSKDAALRERILGSASSVTVDANGCPASPPDVIRDSTPAGPTAPASLGICVYAAKGLLWSGAVGAKAAAAYGKAAGPHAPGATAGGPANRRGEDEVYLRLADAAGRMRWDRYDAAIGVLSPTDSGTVLVPATVANTAPWAKDNGGVKAYVIGGGTALDAALQQYFRGILG